MTEIAGANLFFDQARRSSERTLDAIRTLQARSRANIGTAVIAITVGLALANRESSAWWELALALVALVCMAVVLGLAFIVERPVVRHFAPNLDDLWHEVEGQQFTEQQLVIWTANAYREQIFPSNQRTMAKFARLFHWQLYALTGEAVALVALLFFQMAC